MAFIEQYEDISEIIEKCGFTAATIYQYIRQWIISNEKNKKDYVTKDNKTYMYQSQEKIAAELHTTRRIVIYAIDKLINAQYLEKKQYGKYFDRTTWYCLGESGLKLEEKNKARRTTTTTAAIDTPTTTTTAAIDTPTTTTTAAIDTPKKQTTAAIEYNTINGTKTPPQKELEEIAAKNGIYNINTVEEITNKVIEIVKNNKNKYRNQSTQAALNGFKKLFENICSKTDEKAADNEKYTDINDTDLYMDFLTKTIWYDNDFEQYIKKEQPHLIEQLPKYYENKARINGSDVTDHAQTDRLN